MANVIEAIPLAIDVNTGLRRPSITINGIADSAGVSQVLSTADRLVDECGCCVSLDMAGVESFSPDALESLAEYACALKRRNRRLHLACASRPVRDLIQKHLLSGLFCTEDICCQNSDICVHASQDWEIDVFSLPSSMSCCHEARARVSKIADTVGFGQSQLSDVLLAVGEAVANAVTHGSTGSESDVFTVSCMATAQRMQISISDQGDGFRPDELPSMEEALFMEHGRGVHCMRAVMDDLSFCFDGGTTVRMVKFSR